MRIRLATSSRYAGESVATDAGVDAPPASRWRDWEAVGSDDAVSERWERRC